MNWKCLFGHKWEYIPIDKIEIIQEGVKAFGNYGQDVHWYEGKGIVTKMRVCLRCGGIEEWVNAVTPDFPTGWNRKWNLTPSENKSIDRHIKLMKLLDDK